MTDIPEDVMRAARMVCQPSYGGATRVDDERHVRDVAEAIMDERERCARVADNFSQAKHIVHSIKAGKFPIMTDVREAITDAIRSGASQEDAG
jgi:predicted polyphosphate/ATP-dependent NAD kinase